MATSREVQNRTPNPRPNQLVGGRVGLRGRFQNRVRDLGTSADEDPKATATTTEQMNAQACIRHARAKSSKLTFSCSQRWSRAGVWNQGEEAVEIVYNLPWM